MSGFIPPAKGEGEFICVRCGLNFSAKKTVLSEIVGDFFVKCPKCGSLKTKRAPWVMY